MSDGPQSDATTVPPATAGYEFNTDQNKVIADLARSMQWLAVPLRIVGILYGLAAMGHVVRMVDGWQALFPALMIAMAAILYFMLGTWTKRASESFVAITESEGQDISHLMVALENLGKKYSVLSLFVKIYLFVLAIGVIGGLIWLFTAGAQPPGA